jgi:hypothetical protein
MLHLKHLNDCGNPVTLTMLVSTPCSLFCRLTHNFDGENIFRWAVLIIKYVIKSMVNYFPVMNPHAVILFGDNEGGDK